MSKAWSRMVVQGPAGGRAQLQVHCQCWLCRRSRIPQTLSLKPLVEEVTTSSGSGLLSGSLGGAFCPRVAGALMVFG